MLGCDGDEGGDGHTLLRGQGMAGFIASGRSRAPDDVASDPPDARDGPEGGPGEVPAGL